MSDHAYTPHLLATNTGAVLSQVSGHMGDIAAFFTILVNIAVLYRMWKHRKDKPNGEHEEDR